MARATCPKCEKLWNECGCAVVRPHTDAAGCIECRQLRKDLAAARDELEQLNVQLTIPAASELYPLTLTFDRYLGQESGGEWVAWRHEASDVPEDYNEGSNEDQREFWAKLRATRAPFWGAGNTPKAAIDDLRKRINDYNKTPDEDNQDGNALIKPTGKLWVTKHGDPDQVKSFSWPESSQRLEPRTREEWPAFIAESLRFEFQELVHGAIAERVWTMEELVFATGMPLEELQRVISDTPAPDITLQEMAQVLSGFPGLTVELRIRHGLQQRFAPAARPETHMQPVFPEEMVLEVLKGRGLRASLEDKKDDPPRE